MNERKMTQTNQERPLRGRVAWVTGSSQGIGRAIANELAGLGARMAVHGIHEDSAGYFGDEGPKSMQQVVREIAGGYDTEAMAVIGDLTDEDEVRRTADDRGTWPRRSARSRGSTGRQRIL